MPESEMDVEIRRCTVQETGFNSLVLKSSGNVIGLSINLTYLFLLL